MSGHSKWATIHRAKEINDAKRGAAFTKLAQMITLAAKQGKGLTEAVDRARVANMPKDNIQRAIDHGVGGGDANSLAEVMYEGFGPGGIGILVSAITDNKLRTAQKVREVLDKEIEEDPAPRAAAKPAAKRKVAPKAKAKTAKAKTKKR